MRRTLPNARSCTVAEDSRVMMEKQQDRHATSLSFKDSIERYSSDGPSIHGCSDIALETLSVGLEVFCGFFVERIGSIRFEEEEL